MDWCYDTSYFDFHFLCSTFQMSVKSNSLLLWFCITSLLKRFKYPMPLSRHHHCSVSEKLGCRLSASGLSYPLQLIPPPPKILILPHSIKTKTKTKTNLDSLMHFFPHFVAAMCMWFQFWLVFWVLYLCSLWLARVITLGLVFQLSTENCSLVGCSVLKLWSNIVSLCVKFLIVMKWRHFFQQTYLWSDKYRPRKPRFFNRVHTVSLFIYFFCLFVLY